MAQTYSRAQRALQDRFDTRRLADRLAASTTDRISEPHRTFIEARDMFFIATTDAEGWPQVSYKGGDPGFVRVVDERTIAFPVYNGNGMYLTVGNIQANPKVGLLFIDLEGGTRLRLNGLATIDVDGLAATYPGAELAVFVEAREVFANCRRYVHHYERVERSPFVPAEAVDPPVPDWKLDSWFAGTLPANDRALDPEHPRERSIPQF